MRPMRGVEGRPHVDGGGSEPGPPPSVFPRPSPDMFSFEMSHPNGANYASLNTATY